MVAKYIVLLAVVGSVSSIAAAKDNAGSSANDPNARVCEDIIPVGTRLAVKRVCATRAQWEEKRRRDRELADEAQRRPCLQKETSAGIGALVC